MPKLKKIQNNETKKKDDFEEDFDDFEDDDESGENIIKEALSELPEQIKPELCTSTCDKPKIRSISTSLKKYRTLLDKYKEGLENNNFEATDDDELDLRMINMFAEWLAKKVKVIIDVVESKKV